ncbi:uncharacterized protein LOC113749694 [Coffea eugenioides]|uniref:Glutaredoxin-like protein n=1 Tax=Coffea arabica TaxID=13443 RepID=A0A6P6ULP5_COFAR|nr:uncharacterized protein LOC113749694 [Coffea eugenioides]
MATGTAAMAAMAARIPVSTWPTATRLSIFHGQVPKWRHRPRFSSSHSSISASSSPSTSRKLVLYSKPGCCLCDGLKEKLQAALCLSGPDSIQNVELQIRDITTNPCWEKAYQYEIPVLAVVRSDGFEETLPRLSPRLGIELIQKKLAAALSE